MKQKSGFSIVEEYASGDFIFDAYGETLEDLFTACARACFHAMTELDQIQPLISSELEVSGEDINELLFNFVSELIYLKDAEKTLYSAFKIEIGSDHKSLRAVVFGETIDHSRHTLKTDVKAVTYHGLDITKYEHGYKTRVILDL